MVDLYQAHGINLKLDVALGGKYLVSSNQEKVKTAAERLQDEADSHDLPLVYVGGHQVSIVLIT